MAASVHLKMSSALSAALALEDPAASLAAVKKLHESTPTDAPTAVACADLHLRIGMARAAAKYCAAALSADATMVRAGCGMHCVGVRTTAHSEMLTCLGKT